MKNEKTTQSYCERLPVLRQALAVVMSDAAWRQQMPLEELESEEDRAHEVFGELWCGMLRALLQARDCDGRELGRLVAGIVEEESGVTLVPVVGTIVGKTAGGDLHVQWDNLRQTGR